MDAWWFAVATGLPWPSAPGRTVRYDPPSAAGGRGGSGGVGLLRGRPPCLPEPPSIVGACPRCGHLLGGGASGREAGGGPAGTGCARLSGRRERRQQQLDDDGSVWCGRRGGGVLWWGRDGKSRLSAACS